MVEECFSNDLVHMYVSELTSRIVAESGIPSDRFHLGKIVLQSFKDDPDFVMQIDGATGQSETNGSVLKRTVQCAISLKNMGLKKGDVMVLMAPNHLDLTIPFYAGWYLGLAVAPTDMTMEAYDLERSFDVVKPKIVFCQSGKVEDVQIAIKTLGLDTTVISFDKSARTQSFSEMMNMFGNEINAQEFRAEDFDPEETIALLIPTSGTTGAPKAAALTHKNMAIGPNYIWSHSTKFPSPTHSVLLVAPLQWLSSLTSFVMSPYIKYTRIQSSGAATPKHLIELMKKYEPTFFIISTTMLASLLKSAVVEQHDFTNFELVFIGGGAASPELVKEFKPTFLMTSPTMLASMLKNNEVQHDFSNFELLLITGSAVSPELIKEIKSMSPKTIVPNAYGMTELGTIAFQSVGAPLGSMGKRIGCLQYRLVDVITKEDIKEPNKPGELWLKGPNIFKGYYNNPEMTKEAFAEGGWFMSGDLMYRNESWNYFFVERIKLLLKYRNHQISPVELEAVIRQHPGVLDVAVTGVPDPECGDLAVACIVKRSGYEVTKEEITDLVKKKLSDSKQLRGGVIFLSELPLTPSTKLHRRKIKEIVMERINELELRRD